MSENKCNSENPYGERPDVRGPGSAAIGDCETGFACHGAGMGEAMSKCPCVSTLRRHPFLAAALLGVAGLALLVIPSGAILGIIAFFRTV